MTRSFSHINSLAKASQDFHSSRSSLALKQAYTSFIASPRRLKPLYKDFPNTNMLALSSQSDENCFLDHLWTFKQASTCFRAPPRRLKRRYKVVSTDKLSCTSLIGPAQWRKMQSRYSWVLKQAYTCFTAPPRRVKRSYQVFPTHKQACTSRSGPPKW